jgi:hypothetical protein
MNVQKILIPCLSGQISGPGGSVWDVKHQRVGMLKVEKQMHVSGQIDEEWGNVEADRVCGRIRKMALKDEQEWLDKVDGWSVKHRELEEKYGIIPDRLVDLEAIKLPTRESVVCRRWGRGSYLLICSGSCVGIIRLVGKVADWIYERLYRILYI